ncbi:MAG: polyphosphate kinase 1 [Hyphomicrobiales bacterium]|nr:polyphosphate kinase 1 [Hyphomicrobiales bacterium]MCP5374267.1 polyphosphate kinase 1 [Hyphomicrobiales bacterium]
MDEHVKESAKTKTTTSLADLVAPPPAKPAQKAAAKPAARPAAKAAPKARPAKAAAATAAAPAVVAAAQPEPASSPAQPAPAQPAPAQTAPAEPATVEPAPVAAVPAPAPVPAAAPSPAPVPAGSARPFVAGPRVGAADKFAEQPVAPDESLDSPLLYLNRELTWLNFNYRVFHQARDPRLPLLERLKFLAISASNLEEFSMKRIGGLKQQVRAGMHEPAVDGRSPQEQIDDSRAVMRVLQSEISQTFLTLKDLLANEGILFKSYADLTDDERKELRAHYYDNIFPLVTPQAMDPAHPFPFISNLSLNILVALRHPGETQELLARVKVPVGRGATRFIKVGDGHAYVALEEIMANNLDLLFPDMEVDSYEFFRVIRNANTEKDEEQADDLLSMIETELRDRKLAPIVRMEVMSDMNAVHRGMLAAELGLDEPTEVFETDVLLGPRDLMEIATLEIPALHDKDHHPADNVLLLDSRNIFHIIRQAGPILLHHPYESFSTSVERFMREASRDPKVLAIKMTLYRTSAGTRIVDYLVDAARNGKQVAVTVELKARFDEEANIRWANRLEEVGVNVTYGVVGLKTHSKVILVIRRDYNGLRRYAHIGTGNYHAGTARIYSDLGLLTCDPEVGQGLTELFNYLTTGYKPKRDYKKLLPAPKMLKPALLDKIEREIDLQQQGVQGLIRFKANALEDVDITRALYRASRAGVRVQLIIRDTCRLRPGLPGQSDNVTVISVVGRFLEHTRIFHFRNGGADEYLIGSADLMKRNLESRVEMVTPVDKPELMAELDWIMQTQLSDDYNAWDMQPDGTYVQRMPADGDAERAGCQQALISRAEQRLFEATRLRKRKPRGVASRTLR